MLVTDFLPTVVNNETYQSIFADRHHPTPRLPGLQNDNDRLKRMPVEFSVAAFRFGHSMIRPQYRLNTTVERRPIFLRKDHDATRVDDAADLGGFRPIPSDWAIDWQFFIDLEHGVRPAATAPLYDPIARRPQRAYKIDTSSGEPPPRPALPDRLRSVDAGAAQPRTRRDLQASVRAGCGQGTR